MDLFILPLLLAVVTATVVARTLDRRSIYDARFTDREAQDLAAGEGAIGVLAAAGPVPSSGRSSRCDAGRRCGERLTGNRIEAPASVVRVPLGSILECVYPASHANRTAQE